MGDGETEALPIRSSDTLLSQMLHKNMAAQEQAAGAPPTGSDATASGSPHWRGVFLKRSPFFDGKLPDALCCHQQEQKAQKEQDLGYQLDVRNTLQARGSGTPTPGQGDTSKRRGEGERCG